MKTEDHRKVLEMDMTQLYALRARNHVQLFSARADVTQLAALVVGTSLTHYHLVGDRCDKLSVATSRLEDLYVDQHIVNQQLNHLRVLAERKVA